MECVRRGISDHSMGNYADRMVAVMVTDSLTSIAGHSIVVWVAVGDYEIAAFGSETHKEMDFDSDYMGLEHDSVGSKWALV